MTGTFADHVKSKSDLELPRVQKQGKCCNICLKKRGVQHMSVKELLVFAYIKIIWEFYIHFSLHTGKDRDII